MVAHDQSKFAIYGRSSSSFTRVARIFAAELRVDYVFHIVRDLMSSDASEYAGNPALRMPTLQTSEAAWFGALNICKELARRSEQRLTTLWPEDLRDPLIANAQELVLQAMATEVSLIMAKVAGGDENNAHQAKMKNSLLNSMFWLEAEVRPILGALPPERDLSYLEVTLFCLLAHLEFRGVLPITPYPNLGRFCQTFGMRPSVVNTAYRFDT